MRKFLLYIFLGLLFVGCSSSKKTLNSQPSTLNSQLSAEEQAHFDAIYFDAIAMQQYGKTDEAFALMQRALEIDSLSAPALYYMSDAYKGMQKPQLALLYARRAVAADKSGSYWYRAGEGELLMQMRRFKEAEVCYKDLAERFPQKSDPLYSLVSIYIAMDSLQQCYNALEKIEELDGVNSRITMQKFYILQDQNRGEEAFEEYDKLIARYPYELQYRIEKGDLQMKFGQIQQAKQTYDDAWKIDPDNAYVWVALSNYYTIMGEMEEADSLVQGALVNANLDIETKISILTEFLKTVVRKESKGQNLDSLKIEIPQVDSLFLTIEKMHPTAPEVYDLHADYLAAIGNDSLAAVQERFACDLKPQERKYWERLLSFASNQKDYPALLSLCEEIETLHPDMDSPYTMRAWVFYQQERYEDVIAAYRTALEKADATAVNWKSQLWGNIGDTYHMLGDMEKVYESYDEALKYNDKNYNVLNNYAYFLSEESRDLLKAEAMAQKVIQKYPDNATYLDTYAWILYQQGSYMLAKFYQQRAIDNCDPKQDNTTLHEHMEKILEALGEKTSDKENEESKNE